MRKLFFSLKYKFIIASLILIIVPLLIVSTVSYLKSYQVLFEKIGYSNVQTLKQIGQNIDFMVNDIENTSLYLIQNKVLRDYLKLETDVGEDLRKRHEIRANQELMHLISVKDYVHSISIVGNNTFSISTGYSNYNLPFQVHEKMKSLRGRGFWLYDILKQNNEKEIGSFSFLRQINDINDISRSLGWMRINIPEEKISRIYTDQSNDHQGDIYIVNKENEIILADKSWNGINIFDEKLIEQGLEKNHGFYIEKKSGKNYLVSFYNLSFNDLRLVNIIPLEYLTEDIKIIKEVTIYAIIISLIICLLLTVLFYYNILHPLEKVRRVMREVEKGNLDIKLDEKGNDEIALISKSFNKMSAKLNELIQRVYLFKIKERETELKALQAQINPHFLYNTLDTIYWMSRMEKAFSTSDLIHALAKLFRLSIGSSKERISLQQEIEHLKSYLTIQKERYSDTIDFEFNIDDSLLECKVIKLILQPLVENAIIHGIEKNGEAGFIKINIYREGKYLIYCIEDNGAGADEQEILDLINNGPEGKRGFGLKNVNDRLKLFYGEDCGLSFKSKISEGTMVIVKQYIDFTEKGDFDHAENGNS
ncbi:MAG: sensor histidine kinase [Bacillota bacterium]